jgi:hypothetical protein
MVLQVIGAAIVFAWPKLATWLPQFVYAPLK